MTKPIKVHATDATDAQIRERHASIEKRLDELGRNRVQMSLFHGGLPSEWNPIIYAWLDGHKLEPESEPDKAT